MTVDEGREPGDKERGCGRVHPHEATPGLLEEAIA